MRKYFLATRPWSFPASVVPVLVGTAAGYVAKPNLLKPVISLGMIAHAVCVHAGANLVNTYFDFLSGLDKRGKADDRTLVDGVLSPVTVAMFAVALYVIGVFSLSLVLTGTNSDIIQIEVFGLVLSVLYSSSPFSAKRIALGDVVIFLCFGPLLALLGYFGVTNELAMEPLLLSVPIGLLTDAILHANNARDADSDRRGGVVTVAQVLSWNASVFFFMALLLVPYAIAAGLALSHSYWFALPLVSLPIPLKLIESFKAKALSELPQETAPLGLIYGMLLCAAVVMHGKPILQSS